MLSYIKALNVTIMGHFWVDPSLCFKARLIAKPLTWKWVFIRSFSKLKKISQNDVFYTNQNFQSQSINVYKYFQANNNNNNNNNNR